ncbi:MAG TPA: CopG family transcriptional regulator [Thermoanaerobaculia bacterium]|nr:CopG family transcriptional regulator [Thermoanaerobaculia bacterium]
MKTVQMTLDEDLVEAVDRVARKLGKSRSAFAREALREALARVQGKAQEAKHRAGYARKPVRRGEFSLWESEQVWPEP